MKDEQKKSVWPESVTPPTEEEVAKELEKEDESVLRLRKYFSENLHPASAELLNSIITI